MHQNAAGSPMENPLAAIAQGQLAKVMSRMLTPNANPTRDDAKRGADWRATGTPIDALEHGGQAGGDDAIWARLLEQ